MAGADAARSAGPPSAVPDGTGGRRGRGLRRELGLSQVTASAVGIIIGAGIYVLLGPATAKAGAAVWLSFLVAGLLSALTALSYAELASMFPSAGAEFEYARQVWPPWLAFIVGWVMVVGLIVAGAAVALGFAAYLQHFFAVPLRVGALGLLGVVAAVAGRGIRRSARLTVVLSLVQISGLVLIIAIGAPHVGEQSLITGASIGGVVSGAALVFFAFIGFDEVITLSDETRDPSRKIPQGLLLGLAISTLLYVAVAIAAVSVLGPHSLAIAPQPLTAVMQQGVGPSSADLVAAIALVATLNTTLLLVTAASRLLYGMASRGALPSPLTWTSQAGVPWVGVLIAVAGGAASVLLGHIEVVASVTDFAVYLVFLAVNAIVVILRWHRPDQVRPFRVPVAIGRTPVLPLAAVAVVAVLLPGIDPAAALLGTVLVLVGLLLHAVIGRRERDGTSGAGSDR